MRKLILIFLFTITTLSSLQAQAKWSVKTNLPHLLTATPNLGVEYVFARKYSFEFTGGINPFTYADDAQLKHWVIWPEVRYWTLEPFNGHFFALHAVVGQFDIGGIKLPISGFDALENRRYDCKFNGAGASYGYQWIIGNTFILELSAGFGMARFEYDGYTLGDEGFKVSEGKKNYFGPTKGAIAIGYVF